MDFRDEIEKERKEFLGLNKLDTKKIFESIINFYKEKLIKSPRKIIGYAIDIVICNMNYYNKLGKLENLSKAWGDSNFYVDLRNSTFSEQSINELGDLEGIESISFKDISELTEIENISFSLKEIIDLCKEYNISIKIYAQDKEDYETTLEISPYLPFTMNDSIKTYLNTLK